MKTCEASPAVCVASVCPEASRERQLSDAKQVCKCALHSLQLTARDRYSKQRRSTEYTEGLLRLAIFGKFSA